MAVTADLGRQAYGESVNTRVDWFFPVPLGTSVWGMHGPPALQHTALQLSADPHGGCDLQQRKPQSRADGNPGKPSPRDSTLFPTVPARRSAQGQHLGEGPGQHARAPQPVRSHGHHWQQDGVEQSRHQASDQVASWGTSGDRAGHTRSWTGNYL